MKIRRKIAAYPASNPSLNGQEEDRVRLLMAEYFDDSWLQEVCLRPALIRAIHHWVTQSMDVQPVPEVGGFLLGQVDEVARILRIEHFVPATATEYSSPIRLDFSYEDVLALDQALERLSPLTLVGWFHTHPGHTPYLSETDLSTHLGFFRKEYMVAIVLDPLTPAHDTGIFGLSPQGRINNQDNARKWLSWKTISILCDA